ncbi:hypothetical protein [Gimesia aquarii]|nr:hypothetical protein [Gimesia aquarii]
MIESKGRVYNFNSPPLNGRQFHPDGPFIGAMPSKVKCTWQDQRGQTYESNLSIPKPRKDQGLSTRACFLILPDQTIKVATFSVEEMRDDAQVKNGLDRIFASNGGPVYEVDVKNRSGDVIQNIAVYFGKYSVFNENYLDSEQKNGQLKGNSGVSSMSCEGLPYKITDSARIEWDDEQGKRHQQIIQLKNIIPADLNGRSISFTIGEDDQVVLSTYPSNELQKWIHHNFLTDKGDLNK